MREQHNNRHTNVKPLVPRYLRIGVKGRPRQRAEISRSTWKGARRDQLFRREGVQAVSICFMNAFANPAHESAAAELVRKELRRHLTVSTQLLPRSVSTTASAPA